MSRYRVTWSRQAAGGIEGRLPETVAAACLEFILGVLAESPHRVGKPLRAPLDGLHSARRGEYRVIYRVNDAEGSVHIVAIRHRRDAYDDVDLASRVSFNKHAGSRGEPYIVPDRLWRLDVADALAAVVLPGHLHWSGPSRIYRLADRVDRARVYEIVLREGTEADLLTYVDGALLVDVWDELVLPAPLRAAWEPLNARYRETAE